MNRFINLETHSAPLNMALDEACMEAVAAEEVPLTIRLYRWNPSAVSIGNFQCLADEVDVNATQKASVAIVRRETGGGAVYHDAQGEVTYSIIGPLSAFPRDVIASYKEICSCIISGLAEIGITALFRPINDVIIDGKKVSGNAQTRKGGVLLQHGTILLKVEGETMFTYLTPDKSKVSDKPFIKSVKSSVCGVLEHVDVTREQVERAIADAFKKKYNAMPGNWTRKELERAKELERKKYALKSWNEMR